MLTKLEDFQTLKTTKAKVRSSWIRRTFTKKKWGCAVVKNGKFVKKMKAAKRKKVTVITNTTGNTHHLHNRHFRDIPDCHTAARPSPHRSKASTFSISDFSANPASPAN